MDLYDYGYYGDDIWGFLAAFAAGAFVVVAIIFAILLLLYILNSIGLMTIARNRGISNPWLVWIPYVGSFTLGAIADDIAEKEEASNSVLRFILLGASILSFLLTWLFDSTSFTSVVGLALYVLNVVALHKIFKSYRPYSATVWTVLCAIPFTAFMQSIFPFVMRNDQPAAGFQGFPPPGGYAPPSGGYSPPPPGEYQPPGGSPPQAPGGNYQGGQPPYQQGGYAQGPNPYGSPGSYQPQQPPPNGFGTQGGYPPQNGYNAPGGYAPPQGAPPPEGNNPNGNPPSQ